MRQRVGEHLAGIGQVIVTASCTFIEPLVHPGTVAVRMYLGPPGRSSVDSQYELIMEGRTYAEGAAKLVWIDNATLRSVPIPDALRELCIVQSTSPESMT